MNEFELFSKHPYQSLSKNTARPEQFVVNIFSTIKSIEAGGGGGGGEGFQRVFCP